MELRKRKEAPPPAAPPPKRSAGASSSRSKKPAAATTAASVAAPSTTAPAPMTVDPAPGPVELPPAPAPEPETAAPAAEEEAPPAPAPGAGTATVVDPAPDGPEDAAPPADAVSGAAAPEAKDVDAANDAKSAPAAKASGGAVKVGDVVELEGFGGKILLDDGTETTFGELVGRSGKGVVVFSYPKASTPGCTKQACLFRDAHKPLTSSSFAIYGLSRDSPKSNTTFRTKQNLPYNLICDVEGTLLKALGLAKAPKSAIRGVVVFSKEGKVLGKTEGGPDATLEAAKKLIEGAEEGSVKEAAKEI